MMLRQGIVPLGVWLWLQLWWEGEGGFDWVVGQKERANVFMGPAVRGLFKVKPP